MSHPSLYRSLRMTLAYDGTCFKGWQRHPDHRTVQGEVERALAQVTCEKVVVTSSGRTDAGVHAIAQVAGFHTTSLLPNQALRKAVNAELPDDIFVAEIADAPYHFDPIRDAVTKRYRYLIQDRRVPDLFNRSYVWHMRYNLDVAAMQRAAQGLIGEHDFQAYQTSGSSRFTTVRTVTDILVERRQGEYTERVVVEVEANGFLYNMVRVIVGTLFSVGTGSRNEQWPVEVLESRDRRQAGQTAPAHGLYLLRVNYEKTTLDSEASFPT
jgi:tRNA pseudouridine38-40 synthase